MLARDGDRTVLTMSNDFKGEPKEFAMVVPVPVVLQKSQIHVGDRALIDHIDQWSAPRLVEYWDENPCNLRALEERSMMKLGAVNAPRAAQSALDRASGVRILATYTVGEYDILILDATQSAGLERWLIAHGYRIPAGASRALGIYLKQGMKFFVAKVNVKEQAKLGFTTLRPLQMAYESPKFMLPIRLGMVNAAGPQDLLVYTITRKGRVESANYRTVKLPSDLDVPEFVKDDFKRFYLDLFSHQTTREGMGVVFTEYAWNAGWCDPCASQPLSNDELRSLGAFWVDDPQGGGSAFVTRLHARYDRASFPEDLALLVTSDQENFQGRYVIRHEWKGTETCDAVTAYRQQLRERRATQAKNLAMLTGWSTTGIRTKMGVDGNYAVANDEPSWWEKLWAK